MVTYSNILSTSFLKSYFKVTPNFREPFPAFLCYFAHYSVEITVLTILILGTFIGVAYVINVGLMDHRISKFFVAHIKYLLLKVVLKRVLKPARNSGLFTYVFMYLCIYLLFELA